MSEFNGKQFHGYSVDKDPDLMAPSWSTKNFEFSCIRPETVQRAIDKVQSDVGASLKQRKSHLLSKLREKGGEASNFQSRLNRDIDIETRISHAHSEYDNIRPDKENGYGSDNSIPSPPNFTAAYPRQVSPFAAPYPNRNRAEGDAPPVPPPPPGFMPRVQSPGLTNLQRISIEEYPAPKWVTIEEPQVRTMQIFDVKEMPIMPQSRQQQQQQYHHHQQQQQQQHHHQQQQHHQSYPYAMSGMAYPYLPPPPPPQMIHASGYAYNPPPMCGQMAYQDIYTDCDQRAYLVEDSDLDDEMLQRQHYTQYCQDRPTADEMLASDENDGRPEFVKIAPKEPYTDMSYLKSTAPMRYSELSDDEILQDYKNQSPKVVIKQRTEGLRKKNDERIEQNKLKQKKEKSVNVKLKAKTLAQLIAEEKLMATQRNQIGKVHLKKPRKQTISPAQQQVLPPPPPQKMKPVYQSRPKQVALPTSPHNSPQKSTQIILSTGKSIEQLKAEKVAIFNKMSRTHERIILALETLREKLLEVHEPESTSDRNRRNRNGFEFSVRFLRNFLYPLKGMIDTMRNTTKEQFNSAASNEACNRVAHIYSLFLQAILTYSKQLRHFMIDQVPQKLTTLLEMLFSTTNICLDKRLFDRNDPLVDCMISHCKNFLHFMEDLHARRFVAARESYRKNSEAPETKFNLKMFMNDLNMYEPKLVPKRSSTTRIKGNHKNGAQNGATGASIKTGQGATMQQGRRKRIKGSLETRKQRQDAGRVVADPSEIVMHKRLEADVQTQMQDCVNMRSSELDYRQSREMINIRKILQSHPGLDRNDKIEVINRAIIEALQSVDHGQASEVLKPLLETINTALELPDNAECIEKLLKAFPMKNSKPFKNETQIIYEDDRSEGYCLMPNASRTNQQCSHTSISRNGDGMNNRHRQQQQQLQQHQAVGDRCSGGYDNSNNKNHNEGDSVGDNDDESNCDCEGEDEGDSQSFYESPVNGDDDDIDEENYNDEGVECYAERADNFEGLNDKYNETSEEYDEDAQFYVSGEDCTNYNNKNKKNSTIVSGKRQLETLNENANENVDNETDDRSGSMHASKKQIKRKTSQTKQSPYETKLYRKKSAQSITTPTVIPQTKKSAAAAAAAKSLRQAAPAQSNFKIKQTTSPPSLAMSRLKQRNQPTTSNRTKKPNMLKKHFRRNPMGSPPPAPTVSPTNSVPNTPSLNLSDMHLSLNSAVMSHKGVNTNDRNGNKEKPSPPVDDSCNIDEDDEDTFRADKIEFTAVSKDGFKKDIRSYNDGNVTTVALASSDRVHCESKNSPITLYTGSNPYEAVSSVRRVSNSPSSITCNDKEKPCHSIEESNRKSSKVDFDESGLLLERDQHISLCLRNPLYSNPKFSRPWKMFSRLSEKLTEEVLQAVQSDFANGVEAFVDDFLHLETTI